MTPYMYLLLQSSFLFATGACAGWLIELLYRRFVSRKRWVNPGFLSGPYLPLYGFGTIILYGLSTVDVELAPRIALFAVTLTLLEYITGWFFLKNYHIRLWDYRDEKWHVQGFICPRYSFFWTLLALVFYLGIYPPLVERFQDLLDHLELSYFLGLFAGIFIVDLSSSFGVAAQIKGKVLETGRKLQVNYENLKEDVSDWVHTSLFGGGRRRFLIPFRGTGRHGVDEMIRRIEERFLQEMFPPEKGDADE